MSIEELVLPVSEHAGHDKPRDDDEQGRDDPNVERSRESLTFILVITRGKNKLTQTITGNLNIHYKTSNR